MSVILVVEDDDLFLRSVERTLRGAGHDVHAAPGTTDALAILESTAVDVLLTDLRLVDGDGLTLLERCAERWSEVRTVMMSAFATLRDHQAATDLGAVQVLMKPFEPDELLEAIRQAEECRSGFRGSIHGITLVDVLQIFHFSRRSMTVHIASEGGAKIHLDGGEIIHAEARGSSGEDALQRILRTRSGSVRTSSLEQDTPRTIGRSFDSLLLSALTELDEKARDESASADDDFADFKSYMPPPMTEAGDENKLTNPNDGEGFQMGKIDDACAVVVDTVDGGVACGVVDLDTGMLLGIHNNAAYTQTLNEVVAAAAVDLFRGPNVSRIEQMVRKHRGVEENGAHYFQEIHVSSEHNYHFMKTIKDGKAVIVLVTKKTANIGMGWAMLKSAIGDIEPHVP